MKKFFILLCPAFLAVAPLSAQQQDTVFQRREVIIIDEDGPVSVIGGSREVILDSNREVIVRNTRDRNRMNTGWNEVRFFHQMGVGYNGLVQDLEHLDIPEDVRWQDLDDYYLPEGYKWLSQQTKSINFNLMLASGQYNFTRHFGVGMGLQLEVNNYRFEYDVTPTLDRQGHIAPDWRFRDAGLYLEKTKLVNSFLNVPLTLEVGIGRRNQLQLYGGVVGGWRFNSYTKLKAHNELLDGKERYHGNYNLRNFHYGYTAGVAFHGIGLYATYYPHSIFKAGDVDLRQVNVGILLNY